MKQVSHKILATVMAFVVLFSTMSFTVDMHFCGDTLVATSMFQKATGCGMEMEKPAAEGCAFVKSNCCKDKQMIIDGQDEMQLSIATISFEQQVFITSFIYMYVHLFEGVNTAVTSYQAYQEPLVSRQLYKLAETYLI
ncbi:MAG: HYC_CC_PP family protein [Flavobacteriales bacterium]|jgi:hypothetical protein|tara:strand:- start:9 stop:422 length:414 start_codon:yes stop_codon:yes gene_type:complete